MGWYENKKHWIEKIAITFFLFLFIIFFAFLGIRVLEMGQLGRCNLYYNEPTLCP